MPLQSKRHATNKKQVIIGLIVLLMGTVFYYVDRPPDNVYFVKHFGNNLSRFDMWPAIFGRLGGNLPAFFHVFSFSLISAGILTCRIRGAIFICLSWMLVDILFELGQKYHSIVNRFVPEWFSGILFLENTRAYFGQGSFDINDIFATWFGAIIAFLVIVLTMNKK